MTAALTLIAAWPRVSAAIGLVLAAGAIAAGIYVYGAKGAADRINGKLKDDRITILMDGKEIDDDVSAADDAGLCALLGGCQLPDASAD